MVSLVDDDASQAEIDALASGDGVFSIEFEVDENRLREKLRDVNAGVVNENMRVREKLGWSTGVSTITTHEVYVSDTDHYITQPISTGMLTIFTLPQPISMTNVPVPGGSRLLAAGKSTSDRPILQTLVPGNALHPNGNFRGRRVQLPWGDQSGFDPDSLNGNAKTIMRRAIEWAGDNVSNGVRYKVRWIDDQ